jgi:nucleotide-binding universal stress UspA family protein
MYQKILVPVDGSEYSECALPHVEAVAAGCSVPKVILLRVIEPLSAQVISAYMEAGPAGATMLNQAEEQHAEDAKKNVDKLATQLKKKGIAAEAVTVNGAAPDAIMDYIAHAGVDLVIMTTHGRSGITRWAMGSVADRVIRNSPVPVLIVTPPGCRQATAK